jgi:hypothetical protein
MFQLLFGLPSVGAIGGDDVLPARGAIGADDVLPAGGAIGADDVLPAGAIGADDVLRAGGAIGADDDVLPAGGAIGPDDVLRWQPRKRSFSLSEGAYHGHQLTRRYPAGGVLLQFSIVGTPYRKDCSRRPSAFVFPSHSRS